MATTPIKNSAVYIMDFTNHRYAENGSPDQPGCDVTVELDNSLNALEDKENVNVSNMIKLDETFEAKIHNALDKPGELFTKSSLKRDSDDSSNVLDKNVGKIHHLDYMSSANVAEFHGEETFIKSSLKRDPYDNFNVLDTTVLKKNSQDYMPSENIGEFHGEEMSKRSSLKRDSDDNFNALDTTVVKMNYQDYMPSANIGEFHGEEIGVDIAMEVDTPMEVDTTMENDDVWNTPSKLLSVPEISSLKCNVKPRESLLTTFDPLYFQPCVNVPEVSGLLQSEELLEDVLPFELRTEIENNQINVIQLCEDIINSIVEEALLYVDIDNLNDITFQSGDQTVINMTDIADKVKMSLHDDNDISILHYPSDINDKEKITLLEEQISDVKLQLNASQQIRINLELQLRQKEEVLIKSHAENSRKEQSFQKEIKQLKEKIEKKLVENVDSKLKDLQVLVDELKSQEVKLLNEIATRRADELEYQKIMEEYEKKITVQVTQSQKLREEHETVKCHLANLELAFSDLHQKYERTKKIIEGYKSNEDVLKETLSTAHDSVVKSEEKYETLKAHAKAQIEKSNLEIQAVREHYDSEIIKSNAIIRRLEIKVNSLMESLDQKTKECVALSALCDEVTGQSVIP